MSTNPIQLQNHTIVQNVDRKKKGTNAPLLKIINLEKNILQLFFGHLILELVVATFLTLQK